MNHWIGYQVCKKKNIKAHYTREGIGRVARFPEHIATSNIGWREEPLLHLQRYFFQ